MQKVLEIQRDTLDEKSPISKKYINNMNSETYF